MHEFGVLMTFAGGLVAALILGYLAHRARLSPIVGYLLAGVAVGPFTPGYVADRAVAEQFAEIGVILLLFGIGLRFHLRELLAVWRVAVPGALIQASLSTAALAVLLRLAGWNWTAGIILGMAISVASTVVMALVLAKWRDLHTPIGYIAIGWTVVEDLLTVTALLLLPIIFAPGAVTHGVGESLGIAAVKIAGLVALVVVLGKWVIPWALERIEKTRSRELFTLSVLVLAVGTAVGSAVVFGVSMALGAFLAGLAVGRSEFAARAAGDAVPMRDAFAVLFFVSVGMLFDPRSLVESPGIVALVLLVVVVIKPAATMATVLLLGRPVATAVPVGAAFAQVGEFSFILGTVARGLGLIDDTGWNALVAASIISISINPAVYRLARGFLARRTPLDLRAPSPMPPIDPNRCVLVGFGPVGRIVHQLLVDRGARVTVVDLNLDTVRELREGGHSAVYGDVMRSDTLIEAGLPESGSLILSADVEDAAEIIRQARALNGALRVLVRCTHLRDADALRRAGAQVVAAGEAEVGVALAEAVTADDALSDAEHAEHRNRVRNRLYGIPDATPNSARGVNPA
ncbi:MAG: cation:proton antiporter [Deltaproteobacteria bacterium]|nr:cation:proton antiporter [Deltaproteobacteria bacterium]